LRAWNLGQIWNLFQVLIISGYSWRFCSFSANFR